MAKKSEKTTNPAPHNETGAKNLTMTDLENIKDSVFGLLEQIADSIDSDLTTIERLRKIGTGIRNYGFLDKTSDVANDNMQFAPRMFSATELKELIRQIEELRNIILAANQFSRSMNDQLLITGDKAFQMALMYYVSVRDLARRGVPGAQAAFRTLQPFFRRPRNEVHEPTEPEVERDVKALLKGKKDGKIVIENEKPHLVGGKHIVVDETHKDKATFKEQITE